MDHTIYKVRKANESKLLRLKNVVGVGIGNKVTKGVDTKRQCIKVYVEKKVEAYNLSQKEIIPRTLDVIETDVIEIGKVEALSFKEKMRPAKGGVSIGHYKVSAGTLGCLVRDRSSKDLLILSNNHVLAQSNEAKIGDAIVQPGTYDGGKVAGDLIGYLERFVKVVKQRSFWLFWMFWVKDNMNIVDCAVAKPVSEKLVSSEIMKIGIPKGIAKAEEGMKLQKSGRTTGHTQGEVIDTDMTVKVDYGKFIAQFHHQIMAGAMSAGGDSGSLCLDMNKNAVGLLYAGSKKSTIINPINEVLTLLNIELVVQNGEE